MIEFAIFAVGVVLGFVGSRFARRVSKSVQVVSVPERGGRRPCTEIDPPPPAPLSRAECFDCKALGCKVTCFEPGKLYSLEPHENVPRPEPLPPVKPPPVLTGFHGCSRCRRLKLALVNVHNVLGPTVPKNLRPEGAAIEWQEALDIIRREMGNELPPAPPANVYRP